MNVVMPVILAALTLVTACEAQVIDPSVTQANIHETICVRGYTKKVRPSVAYTQSIKIIRTDHPNLYELDHIVPLELGGHPTDEKNLQLQFWKEARVKDRLENKHHALVCSGRESLAEAQNYFGVVTNEPSSSPTGLPN